MLLKIGTEEHEWWNRRCISNSTMKSNSMHQCTSSWIINNGWIMKRNWINMIELMKYWYPFYSPSLTWRWTKCVCIDIRLIYSWCKCNTLRIAWPDVHTHEFKKIIYWKYVCTYLCMYVYMFVDMYKFEYTNDT